MNFFTIFTFICFCLLSHRMIQHAFKWWQRFGAQIKQTFVGYLCVGAGWTLITLIIDFHWFQLSSSCAYVCICLLYCLDLWLHITLHFPYLEKCRRLGCCVLEIGPSRSWWFCQNWSLYLKVGTRPLTKWDTVLFLFICLECRKCDLN